MRISAVILARDEEKNIKEAIRSVGFCNEVIVIDDGSSDNTLEIASKLGARVFTRALENDFASQRNFGLEKAKGQWVLFLDADERVTPELQKEILTEINKPSQIKAYWVKRNDIIWGKSFRFGETSALKLIRMARKGAGVWVRRVHEIWDVEGPKGSFRYSLLHYPHQTLSEFIEEVNFYSSLHADENAREGKRSTLFKLILWPKMKFFQNIFLRLGILDGVPGFVLAIIMSFNSFLAWAKLWIKQEQN